MALFGCDTFVVLPPLTLNGDIVFGKNSDRPNGEVQEIVFEPKKTYKAGEKLQCTYIEIDQVSSTHATLLSKPSWMWGAEMGANSCGVVIGNEAVSTVVDDVSSTERLLGMDLLRLGLERASNSSEAVSIITTLLEKYGQGGPCSDVDPDLTYHNSYLIADRKEAWVLETAGKLWAAEKLTSGYRNISNCLSIGINISAKSDSLISYAEEHNLFSGKGEFSFKDIFSSGASCSREEAGNKLLHEFTADKKFDVKRMLQVLRDKKSGICRSANDPFTTTGSWVSTLSAEDSKMPSCHWVTATPDPSVSLFKPFIFSSTPVISQLTVSPVLKKDPAKIIPRFQYEVDRKHELYRLHESALKKNKAVLSKLKDIETNLLEETYKTLHEVEQGKSDIESCDKLLKIAVETEAMYYITKT